MAYDVRISTRAQRDLALIYRFIHADESLAARRWYLGLQKAILNLEELPYRWPVTHEDARQRHILYGKKPHIYRVIYRVHERLKKVDILHVRHGARDH